MKTRSANLLAPKNHRVGSLEIFQQEQRIKKSEIKDDNWQHLTYLKQAVEQYLFLGIPKKLQPMKGRV